MDEAQKQAVLSLMRTILVAIGGVLTSKGVLDSETLNIAIGAAMVVIPAAWGIWDKFHAEQKTQAREGVAVNAGIAASNAIPEIHPPVPTGEAQQIIATFAVQPTEGKP